MRIPEWHGLRKPAPLLAILVASLLVVALAVRWWESGLEDSLQEWAVDEIARQTDSTYRLDLGDLSFQPLAGSISFASATVVTDSARNRGRSSPLPLLHGRAHDCRVSGLDLVLLLLQRSLSARVLECRRVSARLALVARPRGDTGAASDTADIAASVRQFVQPLGISAFRIGRVAFPSLDLSLSLERPSPRGGASLVLEHARFGAEDIAVDPDGASAGEARLEATGLWLRPDTLIELSVVRLEAGLTDSTLHVTGAAHEPAVPEDEWVRRVRVRRDRIRFRLDSLRGRGVAYRAFLASGDIGARALELHGPRLDVLTDRRIPRGPGRRLRTPQRMAARSDPAVRVDTVLVSGGSIVYRERKPETERPGLVSFERLQGTVLDLHLPPREEPLRIEASARLMGAGVLTAQATVPLDAQDFRYELSGRLGKMPVKAFNRFLSVNEAYEFDDGWVEEIEFRQTVRDGRARTTVVPRYRELSVEPTGDGGGVIGSVSREVKEFLAQSLVVRSRNPEEEGEDPLVARTVHRYDPADTWLQFLWFSLREGLLEVLKE